MLSGWQVHDDVPAYLIDKIYVYDDDTLLVTGDFVNYVGDDRYNRDGCWLFGDYDTAFSGSSAVFDLRELSSTKSSLLELL